MVVDFGELVEGGLFKDGSKIRDIIKDMQEDDFVFVGNIPFVNKNLIVELYLISNITRTEPEFYFREEDEPGEATSYCLVLTRNIETNLYGVAILESNSLTYILEEKYTDIQVYGQRVFYGLIDDEVVKCMIIKGYDILDFTYYEVEEYASVGQFDIFGVKPSENSDLYTFYLVKSSDEEDESMEYWFTLQTEECIYRFVDGLTTFIDDAQDDRAELEEDYINLGDTLRDKLNRG